MSGTAKVPAIKGSRIVEVRALTADELAAQGWDDERQGPQIVLVLDSGVQVFASRDPEGNGPGCLFGQFERHGFYVEAE